VSRVPLRSLNAGLAVGNAGIAMASASEGSWSWVFYLTVAALLLFATMDTRAAP
jgi:hypothetical protein